MFGEREVKCEVCGKLLGVYGCVQPADIDNEKICDGCKKAIKDARDQVIYLRNRK